MAGRDDPHRRTQRGGTLGRPGAGRPLPAMAGGAARQRATGDRHPQRGIRSAERPGAGHGVGRLRRHPGRAAGAVSACPRGGDAARASGAVRRADRRLLPNRRSPRVGAQRMGARRGGGAAGGARPYPAGGGPGRQRIRRGTRPGGPHRAPPVHRAAGRPLRARGRSAGAGAGAAARVRTLAGLRALPHHRPMPALHGSAVAARQGWTGCGLPLVRPRRTDAAVRALRVGGGARGRRRGQAHRRRTRPGLPRYARGHLGGRCDRHGGRRPAGPGRRHPGGRTARLGRLWRGAAAGHLGAAGPAGPARRRGRPVALDVRGRIGACPGRGRGGDDRRRCVHPDGAIADPVGPGRPRRG